MVVISSPSAVEECFTKNDIVLANRPCLLMAKHVGYDYTTVISSPYGDHWRNLRRIGAIEIFSSTRLNKFLGTRREEIKRLLCKLALRRDQNDGFEKVELKTAFSELSFNIIMRMVAGKRYYGDDVSEVEEALQFRKLVKETFACAGAANPADFLSVFNWLNGYEKRVKRIAKSIDAFLQGLVNEHRSRRNTGTNTMIHRLLSLQESEPQYYTDQLIKGFIMVSYTYVSHFIIFF